MPKSQNHSRVNTRKVTRRPYRLENRDSKIMDYPPNTWAILKPVNNSHLPYIFLTETFNCLGKFPDSSPTHHQLPLDSQISDSHCYIRIENVTNSLGVSSPVIVLEDISARGTMVDDVLVKRDVNGVHSERSKAVVKNRSKISFPASRTMCGLYSYELDVINLSSNGNFDRVYKLGKRLGRGHFSTVYLAKRIRDGAAFAVKILEKPTARKEIQKQLKMIKSEIQILNGLAHDNLIKIYDYFEEPDKIYLVIEYVEDGEFFELFKERILAEEEIRIIFTQLFSAIKYLHDRKIVHRDLKPENILMPSKIGLRIKISDFGLSKLLDIDYSTMQTICGTVAYVAPEVLESNRERSYNRAVDMWSAGVILYACLFGALPFIGDDIIPKIRAGVYETNVPRWHDASDSAKNLLRGLLTKDSFKRLTVVEALNHPFIKYGGRIPSSLSLSSFPSLPSLDNRVQEFKNSDETSTSDLFYSCASQFSRSSTSVVLGRRSYVTASETIRSYSVSESEISSPSECSYYVESEIPSSSSEISKENILF